MTAPDATQTATSTWRLDPAHSSIEFSVKHMMMTTVRGRFKNVTATLTADEEHPEGCCVEVDIETASLDTGVADRTRTYGGRTSSTRRNTPPSASAATGSRETLKAVVIGSR
jgi:polyisoprenoid-binding protein YceI